MRSRGLFDRSHQGIRGPDGAPHLGRRQLLPEEISNAVCERPIGVRGTLCLRRQ